MNGLSQILKPTITLSMSLTVDVAFQLGVAESRFRDTFYDLSYTLLDTSDAGMQTFLSDSISRFSASLDTIWLANGLKSHDELVRYRPPFEFPAYCYLVLMVDSGCLLLLRAYQQLDTFNMGVNAASEKSLLTNEKASSLMNEASDLFKVWRQGTSPPRT